MASPTTLQAASLTIDSLRSSAERLRVRSELRGSREKALWTQAATPDRGTMPADTRTRARLRGPAGSLRSARTLLKVQSAWHT